MSIPDLACPKVIDSVAPCGQQSFNFRLTGRQLPFSIATRHSLFANRCRLTSRQSPVTIRCRLGSAGASPSQIYLSLVPLQVGAH